MQAVIKSMIPVDAVLCAVFFVIPAALTLIIETVLLLRSKSVFLRFLPVITALALLVFPAVCGYKGVFSTSIGGFAAFLLPGTALFMLSASALGWIMAAIIRTFKRKG